MLKNKLLISTALASALFAGAATADIKFNGSATYNYMVFDDSTNGVDLNPNGNYTGREMVLGVTAAGDLSKLPGWKYKVAGDIEDAGTTFGTHEIQLSNGALTLTAGSDTSAGIEDVKDLIPHVNNRRSDIVGGGQVSFVTYTVGSSSASSARLFGSDVLDNTSGKNYFAADVKTDMANISIAHTPNLAGQTTDKEDDVSGNASAGSASSISIKGSFGVEGLTAGAGILRATTNTSGYEDPAAQTYGFTYKTGQFAVGASRQVNTYDDAAATSRESTQDDFGITYSVNDNLSVGVIYSPQTLTTKSAADVDSNLTVVSVGYSLGAVSLGYDYATMDNAALTTGRDVVLHKFTVKAAF